MNGLEVAVAQSALQRTERMRWPAWERCRVDGRVLRWSGCSEDGLLLFFLWFGKHVAATGWGRPTLYSLVELLPLASCDRTGYIGGCRMVIYQIRAPLESPVSLKCDRAVLGLSRDRT